MADIRGESTSSIYRSIEMGELLGTVRIRTVWRIPAISAWSHVWPLPMGQFEGLSKGSYAPSEVAQWWDVSESTVLREVASGALQTFERRGVLRISRQAIHHYETQARKAVMREVAGI